MAALTEGNYPGDFLIDEFGAPNFCRAEGTLASGQDLKAGTVLGANGTTYSAYIDDDGTYGDVAGILMADVDASLGAKDCLVLVRGPAVVCQDALTWHADNDGTEITEGLALLLAKSIVARRGV